MTRTDMHLKAMMRHLSAAKYGSSHGTRVPADATTVPEAGGQAVNPRPTLLQAGPTAHGSPPRSRPHRWARHVGDVMTTAVVTVGLLTPYKKVASLMAVNRVSGFPVLDADEH